MGRRHCERGPELGPTKFLARVTAKCRTGESLDVFNQGEPIGISEVNVTAEVLATCMFAITSQVISSKKTLE